MRLCNRQQHQRRQHGQRRLRPARRSSGFIFALHAGVSARRRNDGVDPTIPGVPIMLFVHDFLPLLDCSITD
ncbi:hypothetical protein [Burkholderia stagnalis]|uniref:hypothetical protein n=1 Tax=Burkholderia stagnalis TaxID=1503054 RepID=UPI001E3A0983|nr:hypothetical protein [Burkholderia stagnalis]